MAPVNRPDCGLRIDASGLRKSCDIKCLKAENRFYRARFYYFGDYDADLAAGKLDKRNLTVSIRLLRPGFELKQLGSEIGVRVDELFCSDISLSRIYNQFYVARRSARLLTKLFRKYFPIS